MKDRFELIETLKVYFQIFERRASETRYLFIGEITSVEDWQKSIKYLVDIGLLDNALVILTGSSAFDLKRSSERLPGRKGYGEDLVYLPLTFGEFLESLGVSVERMSVDDIFTRSDDELRTLCLKNAFLKEYFLKYLNTGGFPKVIDVFLKEGRIDEITKGIFRDFILGDAERYLGSRIRIVEFFKKLPYIVGQRFSWNSLVDVFSGAIESVDTVQKYFEYLGYSFILMNVFFVDVSRKTIRLKKQKKTYPIDKIVADIVEDISGKQIKLPQIIEMVTLRHLLGDGKTLQNGTNLYSGPFFWYSERGNEIDFVFEYRGSFIPVEVKYQSNINRSDYLGMKRVFKKGILITQNAVFRDENIVAIPAWLFFAVFEGNE
nr:ATP-binding protein [Thermotoga sp. Ku-13t]